MDKEVKIYFKVDGLDDYITNLDDLKEALVGVESEAEKASDATQQLVSDSLDATDKLDALEGGVKVLAGALEGAAGAMALLGIETEWMEDLQTHVFGVVALGRGLIDATEGFRLLAENQRLAAAAQRIFNIAANANPYVLLASALTAAAGIFLTWKLNAEEAVPPTQDLADEIEALRDKDLQTDLDELATRLEKLKRAVEGEEQNTELYEAIDLVAELRTKIAQQKEEQLSLTAKFAEEENRIALAKYNFAVNLTDEELQKNIDQSNKIIAYKKEQGQDYAVEQQVLMGFSAALAERQLQDSINTMEGQLEQALNYQKTLVDEAVQNANAGATEAVSVAPKLVDALQPLIAAQLEVIKNNELITKGFAKLPEAAEEPVYTTGQIYQRAFDKIREETTDSIQEMGTQMQVDAANAFEFMGNLATAFTKDEDKRAERTFKINKAAALTQAILSTAVGIATALEAKTLPAKIAQVAFAAATGAAQIATIARQKYNPNGTGGGDNPSTNTPSISYNFGQSGAPSQIQVGQFSSGQTTQNEPVRAYVVATEVSSAQEANAQIQNLSTL